MRSPTKALLMLCVCCMTLAWGACRAVAEESSWEQYAAVQKQINQLRRDKKLDQAAAMHPALHASFHQVLADPKAPKARKLAVGLGVVAAWNRESAFDKSRDVCRILGELPDLSPGDLVKVRAALGDTAKEQGYYDEAVQAYESGFALAGLTPADEYFILDKLATFYMRDLRDPEPLRKVVERMLALGDAAKGINQWLLNLARLEPPYTHYRPAEVVQFAWSHFLEQEGTDAKDRARAYAALVEAKLVLGKRQEANEVALAARADKELPPDTRLMGDLVRLGLAATAQDERVDRQAIDEAASALDAGKIDLYTALTNAAAALKYIDQGRVARGYTELAQSMVEQPTPHYLCRYMQNPPLGAAGWLTSPLLDDPELREDAFKDYKQDDAMALVADVNAIRAVAAKGDDKAKYFDHTAFYMVYDDKGWHIFVLCGEPDLDERKAAGQSLGALEMYFAPTPTSPYYQWIIQLDSGEISTYDWSSPHSGFRSASAYVKTETRTVGERMGTYVFVPWQMVYDNLPFENAQPWLFEVIRWSPAGGLSWSGGKVHNTGKWGQIEWASPEVGGLTRIHKNLLHAAWLKYQAARKTLVDDYWASRDFGDASFTQQKLVPVVTRLDALGRQLERPDGLADEQIGELFAQATPDWMEFSYRVAELRRDYLEEKLTESSLLIQGNQ